MYDCSRFSGVPEQMVIELQGELEVPNTAEGQICLFLYWKSPIEPVCLIGHQIIVGSISKLEKPLLVIDTRTSRAWQDEKTGEETGEIRVVMIIRKLLKFSARPKPVQC